MIRPGLGVGVEHRADDAGFSPGWSPRNTSAVGVGGAARSPPDRRCSPGVSGLCTSVTGSPASASTCSRQAPVTTMTSCSPCQHSPAHHGGLSSLRPRQQSLAHAYDWPAASITPTMPVHLRGFLLTGGGGLPGGWRGGRQVSGDAPRLRQRGVRHLVHQRHDARAWRYVFRPCRPRRARRRSPA